MIIDFVIAGTYVVYALIVIILILAIVYAVLKKIYKVDNDG